MKLLIMGMTIGMLLLVGCDQNTATGPTDIEGTAAVNKTDQSTRVLAIDGVVHAPYPNIDTYADVRGDVDYAIKVLPILSRTRLELNTELNARIEIPMENQVLTIASTKSQQIDITGQSYGKVDEYYPVREKADWYLHVHYVVTTTSVKMDGVELISERFLFERPTSE